MSKKTWLIFVGICLVLVGGLVYLSSKDNVDVSAVDVAVIQTGSKQSGGIGDQVLGQASSKIVFIEYGDFQCPGCAAAHPAVKKVTEKYQSHIAFVFRNFPLASKHPNARAAAATAEAAGLQGKYWEMHHKLYENQLAWQSLSANERTDFFVGYARDLGLNVDTFKTDLASSNVNQKISFDLATGKKAGADATPAFFLNGKKPVDIFDERGGIDEAKLDATFAEALKKQGIILTETVNE